MRPMSTQLAVILKNHEEDLLREWISLQLTALGRRAGAADERSLRTHSHDFLEVFSRAAQADGSGNVQSAQWAPVRDLLDTLAATRAKEGFTPSETASFIFSLKEPLFGQ
jgi:rsbT co-antagonist protein RsbR